MATCKGCQRCCKAFALFKGQLNPIGNEVFVFQNLKRLLLGEDVYVVGVFHLVEVADDFFRSHSNAEAKPCRCPRFGEGGKHDETGVLVKGEA